MKREPAPLLRTLAVLIALLPAVALAYLSSIDRDQAGEPLQEACIHKARLGR